MFHFLLVFFVFCSFFLEAQVQLSTPLEILSFMEASGTPYQVEQLYGKMPAKQGKILNHGVIVVQQFGRSMEVNQEDLLSCEALEDLRLTRLWLDREKPPYRKIIKRYKGILRQKQAEAQVLALLGQVYFEQKKYEQARTYLQQALALNPIDYLAQWYLAELRYVEGAKEEAYKMLVRAHLYNRNHPLLRHRLRTWAQAENKDFRDDWRFDPKYRIYQEGDTVVIAADGIWLTYALYQAVWNYDPNYRFIKENQAVTDYLFQREMEAALGTFLTYQQLPPRDQLNYPSIHALAKALDEEMFEEYVFYEILLFDRPELAYYLTDAFRERLLTYVLKIRIQD